MVRRIDHQNTAGRLLRRFADRPHAVPPMATAEFRVDRDDPSGGPGLNYFVEWAAPAGGDEPSAEAVVAGPAGRLGVSLVRSGVPVATADVPGRRFAEEVCGARPGAAALYGRRLGEVTAMGLPASSTRFRSRGPRRRQGPDRRCAGA